MKLCFGGYVLAWDAEWRDGLTGKHTMLATRSLSLPTHGVTRVIAGSHDERLPTLASTSANSLQIWRDSYGVAFFASPSLDNANWNALSGLRRDMCYASAGLEDCEVEECDGVEHITKADLEHIAICADPLSKGTAAFLLDAPRSALAPDIRDLREAWATSYRLFKTSLHKAVMLQPRAARTNSLPQASTKPRLSLVTATPTRPPLMRAAAGKAHAYMRGRVSKRGQAAYDAAMRARGTQ